MTLAAQAAPCSGGASGGPGLRDRHPVQRGNQVHGEAASADLLSCALLYVFDVVIGNAVSTVTIRNP